MSSTYRISIEDLLSKIKKLNETLWEDRVRKPRIDRWLNNFNDGMCSIDKDKQKECALYLLSNFLFYDDKLVRVLLRSLYEDLFRRPIIHEIRRSNNDTLDHAFITSKFNEELDRTRFLGLGNPSESGCHLLYYFRQENKLKKGLFINSHEIFKLVETNNATMNQTVVNESLRNANISRYVFIDDFCGSGSQGVNYSREVVKKIKSLSNTAQVYYFSIVATHAGLETIRSVSGAKFDRVETVVELDDTFKCFSDDSRYFPLIPEWQTEKENSRAFCQHYGEILKSELSEEFIEPLGFNDGQLLIGFHHNTPDNSLPILWAETDSFASVFPRYSKIYQ